MLTEKTDSPVKALVLVEDRDCLADAYSALTGYGYVLIPTHRGSELTESITGLHPDIILIESVSSFSAADTIGEVRESTETPIIAIIHPDIVNRVTDQLLVVNDFIISPFEIRELDLRIRRLLDKQRLGSEEQLTYGDLTIDQTKCEVTLSGRIISLTFKEYELLKLLVNNQERVFSRDTLLNKVWGYDYCGGDRTVDVHVRRLRSKIEDANHSFIETVRNMGYRFSPRL